MNEAQQTKAHDSKQGAKADTVKVRVRARILVGREFAKRDDGTPNREAREVSEEVYAEAGEVIDMDRQQAMKLAGRSFEGYPTVRDQKWTANSCGGTQVGPHPSTQGGVISDPIVEILQ